MIFNRQSMSGNLSATLIISGVLLIIGFSFLIFILPNLLGPSTDLRIGDGIFKARIFSNDIDKLKVQPSKKTIASDAAQLMIFTNEDKWSINVSDIVVPIDIVWLNKYKRVVYIVKNASPKDLKTIVYEPKTPSKYIIQLNAGTVDSKAIKIDSLAIFQINPQDEK